MMIFNKYVPLIAVLFALTLTSAQAEINQNRPPFSLTLSQVEQWSPDGILADKKNISSVPLQKRFVTQLGNNKQRLDSEVKVLIAPDGMNNFANYIEEQNQFNLYNFTHWSHIDVLNWFAGTANETVSLPSRPWVETAHRNGVKIIGTVYLSVAQYGGNVETVERLLQQDDNGDFPLAKKLVAMAEFYQFDGWLINPETDLTFVKNAKGEVLKDQFEYKNAARLGKKMQKFMHYLTAIAPSNIEIHWYDSMLLDGSVKWQNALNENNAPFLQHNSQRISDAMFMNYWWNGAMARSSRDYVSTLERSRYDLYFGADLSPARDAQRMFEQSEWLYALFPEHDASNTPNNTALSSIALFGNDVNFTFKGNDHTPAFSDYRQNALDYRRFYDTEIQLFAGDDLNLYRHDKKDNWPGIGRFVPAKSTLTQLPFSTRFNTGHGLFKAQLGKKVSGAWHDISQQDILPTWQFAVKGNANTSVFYDFDNAYMGGNSLAIISDKGNNKSEIPLYQTRFTLQENSQVSISYQYQSSQEKVSLWLALDNAEIVTIPLAVSDTSDINSTDKKWLTTNVSLKPYRNKNITRIGFTVEQDSTEKVAINIGMLVIN